MTKAQQQEARKLVRNETYIVMAREVMAGLPMVTAERLLNGKPTQEELALQAAFISGVAHAFDGMNRLGRAPKARKTQIQPKQLRYDE